MHLVAAKADAWHWDGPIELYRPPYDRLAQSCDELQRGVDQIKLTAGFDTYFPRDRADFPEPYWSGYQDFMTTPFGPTPAEAIAQIEPLVELGVTEFAVAFWDLDTLRAFIDEVIPAFC